VRLSLFVLHAFSGLMLTACATLAPRDFSGAGPEFDPVAYFTGSTKSAGVLRLAQRGCN